MKTLKQLLEESLIGMEEENTVASSKTYFTIQKEQSQLSLSLLLVKCNNFFLLLLCLRIVLRRDGLPTEFQVTCRSVVRLLQVEKSNHALQ